MTNGNNIEHVRSNLTSRELVNLEQVDPNECKSDSLSGAASTICNINNESELEPLDTITIEVEDIPIHGLLPITNIRSKEIVENEFMRRQATSLDENEK